MGKKPITWFVQQWIWFFEHKASTNHWHRGHNHYQHGHVRQLEVQKGILEAYVKGLDTHQVKIISHHLPAPTRTELERLISRKPAVLMKIYQKTLTQDDVENEPEQLGFMTADLEAVCSCHENGQCCSHIVAVVLAAAEYFQEDYSKFLIFQGLEWERVLSNFGFLTDEDDMEYEKEDYSLLPVPEGSIRPFESRMGGSPDFWTSSFSFQRMLEEILSKIREEG